VLVVVPGRHHESVGADRLCIEEIVNKLASGAPGADIAAAGRYRLMSEPPDHDLVDLVLGRRMRSDMSVKAVAPGDSHVQSHVRSESWKSLIGLANILSTPRSSTRPA
jgi:hypothetical protein